MENLDIKIESRPETLCIGMNMEMSLLADKTQLLFKTFMPRRNEIKHINSNIVYDLKIYPDNYFQAFNPGATFAKWALKEVENTDAIPEGMESFNIPTGRYAVFTHQGPYVDNSIFQFIYSEWLPQSKYSLDSRPQFDILTEGVTRTDPKAIQEIWVPIK